MRLSRSSLIQIVIGILFSIGFLFLFFKGFKIDRVYSILTQLNFYNFAWVFLATASFLYAKAVRWKIIMAPLKNISMTSSLANISIGLMANNLLPVRMGELVRVASLSRTEKISSASVLSALIVERLLDGYILILFFVFSFYQIKLINTYDNVMPVLQRAAFVALIGYSIILLTLVVLMKYGTAERLKKITFKRFAFLVKKLEEFKAGLEIVRNGRRLFLICFWSVIVWVLSVLVILATLSMFINIDHNIYKEIGFIESIFFTGAISLVVMLPSAPGYPGSFHWACSAILVGFGVSKSFGDSFAIFIHGTQYIMITVLGMMFFWKNHLNFKEILNTRTASSLINRGNS